MVESRESAPLSLSLYVNKTFVTSRNNENPFLFSLLFSGNSSQMCLSGPSSYATIQLPIRHKYQGYIGQETHSVGEIKELVLC